MNVKFPYLFDKMSPIPTNDISLLKEKYLQFEQKHQTILERYYLRRLKRRISDFEFELLMLLFFNIEDIKFNALINRIKDPEKMPFTEEEFYGISLNEALELLVLEDKDKFIIRQEFLTNSYLMQHKIITFTFGDSLEEDPLIFNENLLLNLYTISKIIHIEKNMTPIKINQHLVNRLKMDEEGF